MATPYDATIIASGTKPSDVVDHLHANSLNLASAVSWSAVLAGAATTAILSLILLILGIGLGLSSVSPWANTGVSAMTFGISTLIWLMFTQAIASGAGGYLAGRMRVRWLSVQMDEVYFRDTAHGFLAWAIATIAMAVLMTSVISSIVTGGISAGTSIVSGITSAAGAAATSSSAGNPTSKSTMIAAGTMLQNSIAETLFRSEPGAGVGGSVSPASSSSRDLGAPIPSNATTNTDLSQILIRSLRSETVPTSDLTYLGRWVSQRTGLNQQEAEKRVTDSFDALRKEVLDAEVAAKSAADAARKASAKGALWLFVSLLIGAFVASFAAIFGGRERDR